MHLRWSKRKNEKEPHHPGKMLGTRDEDSVQNMRLERKKDGRPRRTINKARSHDPPGALGNLRT